MTVTLERLSVDGWSRWRDLRLAALKEAPEAFCSSLEEWTDRPEHEWRQRLNDVPFNVVARLDGVDAGTVSVARSAPGDAELISMWVAPPARGTGVGDALVVAALEWSRGQGESQLTLRVMHHNDRAQRLYRRHGFTTVIGGNPSEEIVMVRSLHV